MFGDFSRDSFDPSKHYTRVLMQQGRPLLDADWNEQVTSLLETQRQLAIAMIGWHGTSDGGFRIDQPVSTERNYKLTRGSYFVDGLQCYNPGDRKDDGQWENKALTLPSPNEVSEERTVYLDVWETSVCPVQDNDMLERALGQIDTAWRTRIHWAVRYSTASSPSLEYPQFVTQVSGRAIDKPVQLMAIRTERRGSVKSGPCEVNLNRQFENSDRLYRIEIHRSGPPATETTGANLKVDVLGNPKDCATFKWSRENGSVVAALESRQDGGNPKPSGPCVKRSRRGFKSPMPIRVNSYCELLDAEGRSANEQRRLVRVTSTSENDFTVTPPINVKYSTSTAMAASYDLTRDTSDAYFLRQWDHAGLPIDSGMKVKDRIQQKQGQPQILLDPILTEENCLAVVINGSQEFKPSLGNETPKVESSPVWIELEDGVAIAFHGDIFLEGDYWLVRLSRNGNVAVLPGPNSHAPLAARTHHHYAPIGKLEKNGDKLGLTWNNIWKPFKSSGALYRSFGSAPETPNPDDFALPAGGVAAISNQIRVPETRSDNAIPVRAENRTVNPAKFLSGEGAKALKGYFASPQDLTRRVFARHLNQKNELQSERYKKYRSALLLSEILETSFERYFAKVDRCLALDYAERPLVEADARADYELAMEFERTLMADDRSKSQLA